MLSVEIYQSVSPEMGEVLQKKEVLPTLLAACNQMMKEQVYEKQVIQERFVHLSQLVSLEKQLIVTLEIGQRLVWQTVLVKLQENYPQLVWTELREVLLINQPTVYYFNFIPVAFRQADFPFTVSLVESLKQQLSPLRIDVLQEFKREIEVLFEEHVVSNLTSNDLSQEHEDSYSIKKKGDADLKRTGTSSDESTALILYREELSKEKNAKERIKLANKKLELLIEQMEKQLLHSALGYLEDTPKNEGGEDWHKRIKINLREYSQLFQKAKYLEHSWLMNQSLETKSEKMTISDRAWTYEREQVRQLKERAQSEELFFMMDGCDMIAKRVKIKEQPFFRRPYVRLMKMDYEGLKEKAAYFDVLQGENFLLERLVHEEELSTLSDVKVS